MRFIENIDKDRYEKFVLNHKKSHFLQSYVWGEFARKEKNLIPHYVGLEDDNGNIVATALLLEKKLPLNMCYYYSPRGFVLDYNDVNVLKEFTKCIKNYSKKNNAIFFKVDPDIIYNEEDTFKNVLVKDSDFSYKNFIRLGYKHLGFTKNFETMQPRYSFRINMDRPWEEIENNYSKTTKQRIKKAKDFFIETKIGNINDINTFYNLMILTENRKDFITHNEQYYKSLYEIWNKDNSCNIFLGEVNLDKIINVVSNTKTDIQNELNSLPKDNLSRSQNIKKNELEKRLEKVNNDLAKYTNTRTEYDNITTLSAHFIIEYGDKAWVLYAGNHNILSETYTNYLTYNEHIKYYHDKGIKIYDQFGTIGDLRSDNPLIGLHEFKKKFGGNYVEFIGEFDYIINKPMYFVFTKLVPIYRNLVKNLAKKKRGQKWN